MRPALYTQEESGLCAHCNGFPQKSLVSDLHLKRITLAAPWREVCKGPQQKERLSPELVLLCDVQHETPNGLGGGEWGVRRGLSAPPI